MADDNNRARIAELRKALMEEPGDSAGLLEDIENNAICSVRFDPTLPGVAVQWKGYATSLQMRFVLENVIDLILHHKASRILGDDTLLPMVHADDQAWIINDWYPRAASAGWRVSANKVSESYFGDLTTRSVQSEAPASVMIRPFRELVEARRWLQGVVLP
jgi:hypothetical protein